MKEILEIIKENNLMYLTLEQLNKKLVDLTKKSKTEISQTLKSLLDDGELMIDENNRVFLTSQRGYIKCEICANKKGYGFAKILDNPNNLSDIFIPKDLLNGALDEDIVLVEVFNNYEESREGKVIKVLKHNTEYIVGTLALIGGKTFVDPDDDKFPLLRIKSGDRLNAVLGDKVVAKILFDESVDMRYGVVTECLGKAGTVSAEEMSIIRSFKLRDDFSEDVIKEANAIPDEVLDKELEKRLDLTKYRTITIDGEDSRDFDDAIHVEKTEKGYSVGVHIADVSHYVLEGSSLDDEAYLRGNSVYFPDYVIPMLPVKLSNGICSLREGEKRLTLSVLIELDNDCKVISSKIANSYIISKHRMTYTKVQAMLDGNKAVQEEYKDIYPDILLYAEINEKLKKLRHDRGEIRLDIPEPKVIENDDRTIKEIKKEIQDTSHQLIESLMILANEVVAETYFSKKLPFVYRVHEKPENAKVQRLVDVFAGLGINANIDIEEPNVYDYQKLAETIEGDASESTLMKIILRSLMKARYSDICLGHFGIASTFYCHFTSPIRRYPDLLIHRIIKRFLAGKKSKELFLSFSEKVKTASEQASLTEKRADEAERAVDDYKKALYMKEHLGEKYIGTISGVHEFGIFVELENTIEGLIRFEYLPVDSYDYDDKMQVLRGKKHSYKLGDQVEVICVNANTRLRQIDFDLAERLNNATIEEILAERNKYAKKDFEVQTVKPKNGKSVKTKNSRENKPKKEKSKFKHIKMQEKNKKYKRKKFKFNF